MRVLTAALAAVLAACQPPPAPPRASEAGAARAPKISAGARPEAPRAEAGPTSTPAAVAPEATPAAPAEPLPKGTVVLHVGDSFVHAGLTQRLRERFAPHAVRYEVRAQHSTNSFDWAKRMPDLVAATQPDLVIVTLGGNEIGSKHLDAQGKAVARLVKAIGGRPCVWTTPPLWMEESGLFDAIAANVGPCRLFETDAVVGTFLPRRKDGIHPTAEGGAIWADALYAWLLAERGRGAAPAGSPWRLAPPPDGEAAPKGRRRPLPR